MLCNIAGDKASMTLLTSSNVSEDMQAQSAVFVVAACGDEAHRQAVSGIAGNAEVRVHCSWNQTATATGRLSCCSPNLQVSSCQSQMVRQHPHSAFCMTVAAGTLASTLCYLWVLSVLLSTSESCTCIAPYASCLFWPYIVLQISTPGQFPSAGCKNLWTTPGVIAATAP